jgi:hypothetical protein
VHRCQHDLPGGTMTSSNIEREDITAASSRAWRETLDRTRGKRQQPGEQYQPRHRREHDDGELQATGTTTHERTEVRSWGLLAVLVITEKCLQAPVLLACRALASRWLIAARKDCIRNSCGLFADRRRSTSGSR